MISRKKFIVWSLILVILTGGLTYGVVNFAGVYMQGTVFAKLAGGRVIISETNYNYLMELYSKYSKMEALQSFVDNNYLEEVDKDEMMDGAFKGMLASLNDPYSVYMTKKEFESYMVQATGTYGGIGIYVTAGEDGFITVVSPIEGTPAEKAGIITGDKIIEVDGQKVSGEKLDAATSMMKGKAGTEVMITITREGHRSPIDFKIKRENIVIKTVKHEIYDNIGYIRITNFGEKTYDEFMESYNQLRKNSKVKGLIIDLRNNPGGYLTQTIKISDELVGEGLIVYTEDKHGVREEEKSKGKNIDIPLAILVNGGSASASEILAGAIKDHNAGIIVGTTTFGKGLVQRIQDFKDGSGFRLTISRYFTPSGTNIHKQGITPDIVIDLPKEVKESGIKDIKEDIQLQRAIEEVKSRIQ